MHNNVLCTHSFKSNFTLFKLKCTIIELTLKQVHISFHFEQWPYQKGSTTELINVMRMSMKLLYLYNMMLGTYIFRNPVGFVLDESLSVPGQ